LPTFSGYLPKRVEFAPGLDDHIRIRSYPNTMFFPIHSCLGFSESLTILSGRHLRIFVMVDRSAASAEERAPKREHCQKKLGFHKIVFPSPSLRLSSTFVKPSIIQQGIKIPQLICGIFNRKIISCEASYPNAMRR
jgi:hypothetical protein